MANARDQMKMLQEELQRVRDSIAKLQVEEALLVKMLAKMGDSNAILESKPTRTRSPAVKPVVLDVVVAAGATGATSAEVDQLVRERVPTVAKDTVGSILSRLKADGALVFDGERYYEKKYASTDAAEIRLRAVG